MSCAAVRTAVPASLIPNPCGLECEGTSQSCTAQGHTAHHPSSPYSTPNHTTQRPDSYPRPVQVSNPDDCLYARINGQPVKDLPNYYHVAHTDDMDLAGGFLKVHSEVSVGT